MVDSFISNNMKLAIEQAKKGIGHVNPNPLVGAVIVKDGNIMATGYHKIYGDLHAERNAIKAAGAANCRGADLFVTLEPCCHTGKQPPCTQAIIDCQFKRVFIGSRDPNPLVSGKGIVQLREAGIEVFTDILREECDALNPIFFHYITTKTPYVLLKYAMSVDGLIACHTGNSRWISNEQSRLLVHQEREIYRAIMVGIQTVLNDDPLLTCRIPQSHNPEYSIRQPIRIVCDSHLRTPLDCQLVQTAQTAPVIISESLLKKSTVAIGLRNAGVEIVSVPEKNGHVDLHKAMHILGAKGIDSIMVEGGGTLNYSCFESGIVNKVQVFIAPKVLGSGSRTKGSYTPVAGNGVLDPSQAFMLGAPQMRLVGDDVLLEYEVQK